MIRATVESHEAALPRTSWLGQRGPSPPSGNCETGSAQTSARPRAAQSIGGGCSHIRNRRRNTYIKPMKTVLKNNLKMERSKNRLPFPMPSFRGPSVYLSKDMRSALDF